MTDFITEDAQAGELLRLWRLTLQVEEALQKKIAPVHPKVAVQEGRNYFKFRLPSPSEPEASRFLLLEKDSLPIPISTEETPFVQSILKQDELNRKYRQPIHHDFFVGFPAILSKDKYGKQSLAALFKFSLEGITYPLKLSNQLEIEQEDKIVLTRIGESDEEVPRKSNYWIDELLLQDEFGISDEILAKFRYHIREGEEQGKDFLRVFQEVVLEQKDFSKSEDPFISLLHSINHYCSQSQNMPPGKNPRIFPYALIYELEHNVPTRQLQVDLDDILADKLFKEVGKKHPASIYLFGNNNEDSSHDKILGQYSEASLTASQELAIKASKSRRFTVLNGPPGTGKTHVIRNLFADRLVRFIKELKRPDEPVPDMQWLTLVTSTNNRAVDNALEGLELEGLLPIALRVGSRITLSRDTAEFLKKYYTLLKERKSFEALKEFFLLQKELKRSKDPYPSYVLARKILDAWVTSNKDRICEILKGFIEDVEHRKRLRILWRRKDLQMIFTAFPFFGSTLLSLRNFFPMESNTIGMLVVDEAGQCSPSYVFPALLRSKNAVMIGDTMQLEPVSRLCAREILELCEKRNFKMNRENVRFYSSSSDFPRSSQHLVENGCEHVMELKEHFRCRPEIIRIGMELCGYDLNLMRADEPHTNNDYPALQYVEIEGNEKRYGSSWANEQEVKKVVFLVKQYCNSGVSPGKIAVLTPFRGQLNHITTALRRAGLPIFSGEGTSDSQEAVTVGTVHRFQGGERSIVIFSHVISQGNPTFLNSRINLLNVAVTRAQNLFVYIGSMHALEKGPYTSLLRKRLLEDGVALQI